MAMSYEKFLLDEELCGAIRKMVSPVQVDTDTLLEDVVEGVGIGGEYLSQMETLERCRTEFFLPRLMRVREYNIWHKSGGIRADQTASEELKKRLRMYEKPPIDPNLEAELFRYVEKRKEG
jgi:trimethylamine--corrinoid protein Co-methyltransferase